MRVGQTSNAHMTTANSNLARPETPSGESASGSDLSGQNITSSKTVVSLPAAVDRLRSRIQAVLPKASIVLVGSQHYGESTPDSDHDLIVLTYLPVGRKLRQSIARTLADENIKYDIHFIPRLMVLIGWKNIAGTDLETGERMQVNLSSRIRSALFANRIKMAYYYYVFGRYESSALSLLRTRLLPYAKNDEDVFSFAGNKKLLESVSGNFSVPEYHLYSEIISNRISGSKVSVDSEKLLGLINKSYDERPDNLFHLNYNVRYYVYAINSGLPKFWVNYSGTITKALYHYANGDIEASTQTLSRLTKVTDLKSQLEEYTELSMLEIEN